MKLHIFSLFIQIFIQSVYEDLPSQPIINLFSDDSKDSKGDKKVIDIGKEAAIEAEVRASRERAIVPLEIRIKSFKEMLSEKEVIK